MKLVSTIQPTVTIAIPTYNEAAHIEQNVIGFLQSQYPQLIEVLVVDGGSTDGTQELVQRLAKLDSRVRLLHNPLRDQASALNIAIAEMKGDVFLRVDSHSDYATDYIERCIEALIEQRSLNVGGCARYIATTAFQSGVALATRSPLGSGGSRHRNPDYNGPSDSVAFTCSWKHNLERLDTSELRPTRYIDAESRQRYARSFFNYEFVPNEDAEINARFRKIDPCGIYVSSRIKFWYHPRKNWRGLYRQYFNWGRGRCKTAKRHPDLSPLRAKLPLFAGTTALSIGLMDLLVFRGRLQILKIFLIIGCIPFLESLRVTFQYRKLFDTEIWRGRKEDRPSLFQRWLYCCIALWTMTPSHLAGYTYQLYWNKVLYPKRGGLQDLGSIEQKPVGATKELAYQLGEKV